MYTLPIRRTCNQELGVGIGFQLFKISNEECWPASSIVLQGASFYYLELDPADDSEPLQLHLDYALNSSETRTAEDSKTDWTSKSGRSPAEQLRSYLKQCLSVMLCGYAQLVKCTVTLRKQSELCSINLGICYIICHETHCEYVTGGEGGSSKPRRSKCFHVTTFTIVAFKRKEKEKL